MRDIFASDVFIPTKKMSIYEAIKDVQIALILRLKMLLSLTNIPGRVRVKNTAIAISKRLVGYVTVAKGPRRRRGLGVWGKQPPLYFFKNKYKKLSTMEPRYMFVITRFVTLYRGSFSYCHTVFPRQ